MGKEQGGSFRPGRKDAARECVSDDFRGCYPAIAALLEGKVAAGKDDGWPPYKLSLAVGVRSVRWSFACYESGHTMFGNADGTAGPLDQIETSLVSGEFDEKWYERK